MRRTPAVLVGLCLLALAVGNLVPATDYSERTITVLFSLFAGAYAVVGGLIATLRSQHPVGWLMLGIGVLMTVPVPLGAYAGYALLVDDSLPGGAWVAWVTSWIYSPALAGVVLLVLVFPSGRPTGPVRRWSARVCVVGGTLITLSVALTPGPMDGFGDVHNPAGWRALDGPLSVAAGVGGLGVGATFLVALGSIAARLRTARGSERQQLKWFSYAAVVMLVAQLPNLLPLGLDDSLLGLIGVVVALTGLPVGVAIAILRHRLYDIDRIINQTLVYGSLTAALVATYLASVLVSRAVLAPLASDSDLAVATSTLAVATLFRPARRRIQEAVDRRFFRGRYDAGRTLEAFSARLRQEVALDAVATDLRAVVSNAVHPTHVSLWLREARR